MSWWDNIKDGSSLDPAIERLKTNYERLISHPDYNRDVIDNPLLLSVLDALEKGSFDIETVIDYIHEQDKEGEKYGMSVMGKDEIHPTRVKNWIDWTHGKLGEIFRRLGTKRSLGLLEDMAETMGVELIKVHEEEVIFNHRGLGFAMQKNALFIKPNADRTIEICVVDDKRLPVGDFYAQLLGLLVAKPQELDVVDFGIQLALIIKGYEHINWDAIWYDTIGIFTPFDAGNSENIEFMNLIMRLERDNVNSDAPDMLSEIRDALVDSFGSTRGFI